MTVVRQVGRQADEKLSFGDFKKILYLATCKFLMFVLDVRWTNIFVVEDVSRMILKAEF